MKDIFEKYNEIPYIDFSLIVKKKDARDILAYKLAPIKNTMCTADAMKSQYDKAVKEEEYDIAEESREDYNELVNKISTMQEQLKQAIEDYELEYHESVILSTDRYGCYYCEFVPMDDAT